MTHQLVGAASFKGAMKMGVEVDLWRLNLNSFFSFVWSSCIFWRFCFILLLKAVIKKKYGQDATNVGDKGGFAPNIKVFYLPFL